MKFYFKPILLTGQGGGTGHSSGGGGDNGFDDPFADDGEGTTRVMHDILTEITDIEVFSAEPVPEIETNTVAPTEEIELDVIE